MKYLYKIKNNQKGSAMLVSIIFFLSISLIIVLGMANPAVRGYTSARNLLNSKKSYALAESAGEDIFYRIKNGRQYLLSETLTLDGGIADITITNTGTTKKEIKVKADNSNLERSVNLKISSGDGVSFNYGIQSGSGGFIMDNGSEVTGNVYSGGIIQGYDNDKSFITGTAISSGSNGLIDEVLVGTGSVGDAIAHTVTESDVLGNLYCQVGLINKNGKVCDTSKLDPVDIGMPISDAQIEEWKVEAEAGGVITGDYSFDETASLGPKKITGNLIISDDDILNLTGAVWVQGTIITDKKAKIKLDSLYSSDDGILIADKYISLSNDTTFEGSGTDGSYIALVTTSDCPISAYCDDEPAINIQNNSGAVILNAQNGAIHIQNGSELKSAAAKLIEMINNAKIIYDSGIANSNFVTGPSGTWNISEWKEVE